MFSSFLFGISIILLGLILTTESVYNAYLYDDGHGGEEHCCLVHVRENFCLTTPITRSLIQVNKQCGQLPTSKHRSRLSQRNRNSAYIDKISRRLNVQNIHEYDEKIFIELQKPLEKNIVQNDLICLTSTNKSINFEQCYVELADDLYENHVPDREHRRRKHRGHQEKSVGQMKRPVLKSDEEENEQREAENELNEAENEIRRIEISHPIRVREGHGLSFFKRYQIDRRRIRPETRHERQCLSWYRDHTQKIRRNRSKYCVQLSDARENCINQLISNTFNHTKQDVPIKLSFPIGSKLFCKNQDNYNKLVGHYHHGEICFDQNNQIVIEYKFNDIARLSDRNKNKDALEFIADNEKLTAEFEDDCHGKRNLDEETRSMN